MLSPGAAAEQRGRERRQIFFAAFAIIVAVAAAYHNALQVPFVFDDPPAILENPTIRKLWPLTDVLIPPRGEGLTVEGRPVLNLSLAVNHAIGGTGVRGYHVFNILVHALAALTLFGLIRRTLGLPSLRARFGSASLGVATICALIWAVHPLQTESVTYVIQRAEALVGWFYLLTLYCFVRGADGEIGKGGSGTIWYALAVTACLIGMATKEVMVSAPLLVLLFDRVFLAGTVANAWRARGRVHVALFATWALLAFLVLRTGTRGGTAGFGINVTPWDYALTQFEAVTRYLTLAFWPHPLVFDYGVSWVRHASEVLPYGLVVLALIGGTVLAWRRAPSVAWLGILFFAVLSPTSSIVPGNRQTTAEHRMYLPLAAVVVLTVCSVYLVTRRPATRRVALAAAFAVVLALGILTLRRNFDYRSELALYQDTALKRPRNGFARYNLAKVYAESGQHASALPEYEAALPLIADAPGVHYNLGNSLAALGRNDEAIAHYEAALRARLDYGRAHFNLGNLLLTLGRKEDAAQHFAAAVKAEPALTEARVNLGGVLLDQGRTHEAREHLEYVLQKDSKHVLAIFNLGNVCLVEQRWAEAIGHFERVLALQPDFAVARERLALARRNAK